MENVQIAIIGSGFGGIGTAIRLKQEGFEDFIIFERADDVGGVWRDNTYPGCACDVQSHLYSLSFVPNASWTRRFSRQPEIWAHLRDVVRDAGLRASIRFGCALLDATWDDAAQRWQLATSRGTMSSDVLVLATGPLSEP